MWFSLTIIEPPQLTLYCTGLGCCLTLFIQVFLFYIHAISHFLVYKSRCSFTLRCHPWCHLPTTQNKLPPVSLFFSAAFLQLCGPISLARQVPANLVSSFHSCKRIVTESSKVVLPALVVRVLVAVPPGFHVSNLLCLLLANRLVLHGRGGFYKITFISST